MAALLLTTQPLDMFRLHLTSDDQAIGQYQNYDLDLTTFVTIATGTPVLADIDHEREIRELGDRVIWWSGVYDTTTGEIVNNLTEEQAIQAFTAWWKESLA